MAKAIWIEGQCQDVIAYLWQKKQQKSMSASEGSDNRETGSIYNLTRQILIRSTEYCPDLYNYVTYGNPTVLDCPHIPVEEDHLREEVEAVVKSQKMGKTAGLDYIPAKLVQAEGKPW